MALQAIDGVAQRLAKLAAELEGRAHAYVRGPLPEPFGQHIFGAAADLHALVKGRGIGPAVGQQVVPREQLAGFGLDGFADRLEAGGAAVLGLIEVDHRRPGALAGVGGVHVKVVAAGLERVGVRLELLAGRVALALQRLARVERQAEQLGDLAVDLADDGVAPVEVAGFARPEIGDADVVGDLGRAALVVDPLDQRGAGRGIEEAADDEQLERARRDALDAGRRRELRRGAHSAAGRRAPARSACRAG